MTDLRMTDLRPGEQLRLIDPDGLLLRTDCLAKEFRSPSRGELFTYVGEGRGLAIRVRDNLAGMEYQCYPRRFARLSPLEQLAMEAR